MAKFATRALTFSEKCAAFWGTNNNDHQARTVDRLLSRAWRNTWGYGATTESFNDVATPRLWFPWAEIGRGTPRSARCGACSKAGSQHRANFIVI